MMIEPTETVSKRELDYVVNVFQEISNESYSKSTQPATSPHSTSVTRIDEARANRPKTMQLTWRKKSQQSLG